MNDVPAAYTLVPLALAFAREMFSLKHKIHPALSEALANSLPEEAGAGLDKDRKNLHFTPWAPVQPSMLIVPGKGIPAVCNLSARSTVRAVWHLFCLGVSFGFRVKGLGA